LIGFPSNGTDARIAIPAPVTPARPGLAQSLFRFDVKNDPDAKLVEPTVLRTLFLDFGSAGE